MMKPFCRVKKFLKKLAYFKANFPTYFAASSKQDSVFITIAERKLLNFCTFSYLGLSDNPEVVSAAKSALDTWGVGNHGTRCLGGNLTIYDALERKIQSITGKEKALLFNSGYLANSATIQSLMKSGGVVYSARKNHASIEDGLSLARGRVEYFRHFDLDDLETRIKNEQAGLFKLIVVDSVFSMDGDIVDLPRLLSIREQVPNVMIMLDEAHSLGVLGPSGRGIEDYFNIKPEDGADLLMGSLSKAIPGNGGYIAGREELITYLRYDIRPIIFSSGLPGVVAQASYQSLCILERDGGALTNQLRNNLRLLRRLLNEAGMPVEDNASPITTLYVGNMEEAFELSSRCFEYGLHVLPVFFPAVSKGQERLRITISTNHTPAQIKQGVEILRLSCRQCKGHRRDRLCYTNR